MKLSQRVVTKFKLAKSEGLRIRDTLRNVAIKLDNLSRELDPRKNVGPDWFENADYRINEFTREITAVLFGVHVPEIKKFVVDEVIDSLNTSLAAIKKGDAESVQYGVYVASDRLRAAVTMLAENPDTDELKEQLSRVLSSLLPSGNTEERWYEEALKLSKQIAETEKGKRKAFFEELAQGLQAALDGHLELRRAAAFAYKMLPKAR